MEARLHDRGEEFRALAEPLYRGDPVLHTVELTLLQASGLPPDAVLLTVWDGAAVVGAALATPPYPLITTGLAAESIVP